MDCLGYMAARLVEISINIFVETNPSHAKGASSAQSIGKYFPGNLTRDVQKTPPKNHFSKIKT